MRLLEKIFITRDLVYLIFEKVPFEAGHAIGVRKGDVRRFYSPASSPHDEVTTLLVRLKDGGAMSEIFRKAEPGEEFELDGYAGRLDIKYLEGKVGVLSAGTGIAPFRSLYREARRRGMNLDVIHIHSSRYLYEVPFMGEWERYVIFIPTITRDEHYEGEKGRIDEEKIKKYIKDFKERRFLVCGPATFVASMLKMLKGMGVEEVIVEGW